MLRSLVGSEMCIRDRPGTVPPLEGGTAAFPNKEPLARGNTDEFSPVAGNRAATANNKFTAANNSNTNISNTNNVGATPDLSAMKIKNNEDPHRPEGEDGGNADETLFHRTPSVDVSDEQPDASMRVDLED
eukprot:TRINITY_DN6159_c0_g1_i6.p2 TRINITY_DN6159_c0_g1~~TRINITY_DN6159_c0_g1_i6.p2  ORF type:complete len:131 (+),score=34.02 TRINITY_DN6159_c0_g1_i6:161-553(+)